jgi:alpha-ketoglutaric semialdehyde dehydrogenase
MPETYQNYISGTWVPSQSGETFKDFNPADKRDCIGLFPRSTVQDVEAANRAALVAFPEWRSRSWPDRGAFLLRAADILEDRVDEIAAALTREEGKTLAEARGETLRGVLILRYYGIDAYHEIGDVIPSANADTLMITRREPIGPVALITPWNFPIAIPVWKIAPALVYGNTVVFKPSELSPKTAHLLTEVFAEAELPPGVLNTIHGHGEPLSEMLATSPLVGLSFTGSIEAGRSLAVKAAGNGVKYQLEMGGKNPVIVLSDADMDQAAKLTVSGAFKSAGEKCTATSRAIVMNDVRDEFTQRIIKITESMSVGPGSGSADVGPVISERAHARILSHIDIARKEGAQVLAGGGVPDDESLSDGYYVAPTVLGGVTSDMTIAREEVFGPVLAIIGVDSFDEALDLANDVRYGLSASLFTRDLNRVLEYTDRIEAGLVRVNGETAGVEPQAPFGGVKASSSNSREQGRAALDFYTQVKTVYFDRSG